MAVLCCSKAKFGFDVSLVEWRVHFWHGGLKVVKMSQFRDMEYYFMQCVAAGEKTEATVNDLQSRPEHSHTHSSSGGGGTAA